MYILRYQATTKCPSQQALPHMWRLRPREGWGAGKFMRKLVSEIQAHDSQPPVLSTQLPFCTEEKVSQILSEGSRPQLSARTWAVASLEGRSGNGGMRRPPPSTMAALRPLLGRLGENSLEASFHLHLLPPVCGTAWSRGHPAGVPGRR